MMCVIILGGKKNWNINEKKNGNHKICCKWDRHKDVNLNETCI